MSIYESIFQLLHTHIYGGVALTADMNLTLTLMATCACVFCVALPFIVVWGAIKRICR